MKCNQELHRKGGIYLEDLSLLEKARQERNKYMREYRKRNPEKTKEINQRYWIKKAKKALKDEEGK